MHGEAEARLLQPLTLEDQCLQGADQPGVPLLVQRGLSAHGPRAQQRAGQLVNIEEFKNDYRKLSVQCKDFVAEVEAILNGDLKSAEPLEVNRHKASLSHVKLAITPQRSSVLCWSWPWAFHSWPSVTGSHLAAGLIRRVSAGLACGQTRECRTLLQQPIWTCQKKSKLGKILQTPFMKFVAHTTSFVIFLGLLVFNASDRSEGITTLPNITVIDYPKQIFRVKNPQFTWTEMLIVYVDSYDQESDLSKVMLPPEIQYFTYTDNEEIYSFESTSRQKKKKKKEREREEVIKELKEIKQDISNFIVYFWRTRAKQLRN
ncbi:Short transient receptor potential channel 3 [Plecturocebus cupreus]